MDRSGRRARGGDAASPPRSPIVHIVDDDEVCRLGVARILELSGYRVMAYPDAEPALEGLTDTDRGCILLDVCMPGLSGTQLQEQLAERGCRLPIIFMSGYGGIAMAVRAIKDGAEDFLEKPLSRGPLVDAIERALRRFDAAEKQEARHRALRALVERLTPREYEVFSRVVSGRKNKEIAHELGTTERTIKAHRQSIMRKMAVASVAELVSIAEQFHAASRSATMQSARSNTVRLNGEVSASSGARGSGGHWTQVHYRRGDRGVG